jgi:hypothetical protein
MSTTMSNPGHSTSGQPWSAPTIPPPPSDHWLGSIAVIDQQSVTVGRSIAGFALLLGGVLGALWASRREARLVEEVMGRQLALHEGLSGHMENASVRARDVKTLLVSEHGLAFAGAGFAYAERLGWHRVSAVEVDERTDDSKFVAFTIERDGDTHTFLSAKGPFVDRFVNAIADHSQTELSLRPERPGLGLVGAVPSIILWLTGALVAIVGLAKFSSDPIGSIGAMLIGLGIIALGFAAAQGVKALKRWRRRAKVDAATRPR